MTNTDAKIMREADLPGLPPGKSWPDYMLKDTSVCRNLRETYARIAWSTHGDQEHEKEKRLALEWCRANGNPHLWKATS